MKLLILRHAKKQLGKIPKVKQLIIGQKIRSLLGGGLVTNVEPLSGYKGVYRSRVGDYRIIYKIEGDKLFVILVGHRREIYELLRRLLG